MVSHLLLPSDTQDPGFGETHDVVTVAILGGGQLGLMLGQAARALDVEVRFLDPSPDACARAVGRLTVGSLDDAAAVLDVAFGADVVTYEWEGVPAWSARVLVDTEHIVYPAPDVLQVAQDRLLEKRTANGLGLPTAEYRPIDIADQAPAAMAAVGTPAVLKTRRGGYDGKGQRVLRDSDDLATAVAELGGRSLILERLVDFRREVSVLAARGRDGEIVTWPLVENHHEGGILRTSLASTGDDELQGDADRLVAALLEEFDYVGVLTVELFDVGGELLVNELAPRVHNSGHWTIEGARTSQFENHLRAVLGLPLGDPSATGSAAMLNCIGALPDPAEIESVPGASLHTYGKQPRSGRKLGHVTVVAPDDDTRAERVERLGPLVPSEG